MTLRANLIIIFSEGNEMRHLNPIYSRLPRWDKEHHLVIVTELDMTTLGNIEEVNNMCINGTYPDIQDNFKSRKPMSSAALQ
jgi:hypothetical protein